MRSNGSLPAAGRLEQLLAAAYDQVQKLDDAKENARCRRDFVFHMTDWQKDLHSLAELYAHPDRYGQKEARLVVLGFLYHVIPHLQEAGRLMLDYSPGDVFGQSRDSSG